MLEKRIFYVDDKEGNDAAGGLSTETAWKSLERVNEQTFLPGDEIRLKRGGQWYGMLAPKGNGAPGAPILLTGYGEGEMPVIHGNGSYAAILLEGVSYWTVRGIRVTNRAKERAVRQGICICGAPLGVTRDICVEDCEISHVDGENRRSRKPYESMYWNSGIYVTMPGRASRENRLHHIVISNNYIHDVTTSGIRVNQQEDFLIDIHHTHVVVRGNRIERTGSDGIIVANCISPLIMGNTCIDAGALGSLEDTRLIAGVWVCATSDALIDRNEVAGTSLFENDGTAFDTDWGTAGTTVFQYNYTHGNHGGFWLDCMGLNRNRHCGGTVLRYNISIDDERCLVQDDYGIPAQIYGNLFLNTKEGPQICCHRDGESHLFSENIFCFPKSPLNGWQRSVFRKNWYAGLSQLPEGDGEERQGLPFEIDELLKEQPLSRETCWKYWDRLAAMVERL